jgi:uncharacterized cupredoxin-like copper-binding protein
MGRARQEDQAMLRQIGWGALLIAALSVAACGGRSASGSASKPSGATGGAAQSVTVKGTDTLKYEPATVTARAGAPIHVTLDDSGAALVHDFVIDNAGGKEFKIEAQPHGRATGDMTLPAGTYQFYCSQPGHKEAGMVGTLTVS